MAMVVGGFCGEGPREKNGTGNSSARSSWAGGEEPAGAAACGGERASERDGEGGLDESGDDRGEGTPSLGEDIEV